MAIEGVVNVSSTLVEQVGRIGLWLQALGAVVVLWIFFQIFNSWVGWKRFKEVLKIKDDIRRIEGKINKISNK